MDNMLKRFGHLRLDVANHITSTHSDDDKWDFWQFLHDVAKSQDEMKSQTERFIETLKREQMRRRSCNG